MKSHEIKSAPIRAVAALVALGSFAALGSLTTVAEAAPSTAPVVASANNYWVEQVEQEFEDIGVVRYEPLPGTVALTFDDGPDADDGSSHDVSTTLRLLDVLDELGIKVTFFVNGWKVEEHPEIVAEAARRGHSIQIHAWWHRPFTSMTDARIAQEISDTAQQIFNATGVLPECVRPPFGAVSQRVINLIENMERPDGRVGYKVIIWDMDSADAETQSASVVLGRVNLWEPGNDVLAHDTIGLWSRILPQVKEKLDARGIGFSTYCQVETATSIPKLFPKH